MSLKDELDKYEYRFGTYAQRLALLKSKTTDVIGAIRGDNLRDVVVILAAGLQHRLDNAEPSPLRTALLTGFKYMTLPDYSFNLGVPAVADMLEQAVVAGLVTKDERDKFFALATYKSPLFPDATIKDIVAKFEPHKIKLDDWATIEQVPTHRLMLTLNSDMPEPSTVLIEMRESHNGIDWTNWRNVPSFSNVERAGAYYQTAPFSGLQRQLRWRGASYAIDGTVAVV